jgi:PKD repeat protein
MPYSRQWLKSVFLICLMFLAGSAIAVDEMAPRTFAPVQDGYTTNNEVSLPYVAGRLLVQFQPNMNKATGLNIAMAKGTQVPNAKTGLASVDALAATYNVTGIERPYYELRNQNKANDIGLDRWYLFQFNANENVESIAAAFRADPNVEAVSVDWYAYPAAVPSDPLYDKQWGHENTGQMLSYDWSTFSHENGSPVGTIGFDGHTEQAWDRSQGYGSSSVVIAIIDSGVDVDHPDLNLVTGFDFGDNDSNPDDNSSSSGHGTACAGVAAASANNSLGVAGVAGNCSIMPLKVANSAGSMSFVSIQNAIYYAADNGADIISMSFSADIGSDAATDAALLYAANAGVIMMAATSNHNQSHIRYPANNANVMGIGAASPCGDRKRSSSNAADLNPNVIADPNSYTCDGERWWGSNYGNSTQDGAGAVDILAPTILPTTDIGGSAGYDPSDYSMWFNGTSCSTPYIAGCAALIISANPSFTPTQIRDALITTATDVVNVESGVGWDRYSGYGMVNIDAALASTGPVAPTAALSGTPTSGSYPLNVSFADQSSGAPTSWSWTFGDGGTSLLQNPSYVYNAVGTYTVSLTATNALGNDTSTQVDYIIVSEPGQTVVVAANGETSIIGSVNGSFLMTGTSDGVNEVISEDVFTGHPKKQYSYAEHTWSFALPGGETTFHLEASRTANSEGDDFLFEYSTDGVNYLALATVNSSTEQSFSLPIGNISGAVTVRVTDTDRGWGNISVDDLSVDYLVFEVGDVVPTAPTAEFAGTPVSGNYPLNVSFSDLSTGSPTSWSWAFGDGGTSTNQNPSHTYTAAGAYNVTLTATNATGSDPVTKNGYITVTEPGGGNTMHVSSMSVTRQAKGPNFEGVVAVTVVDDGGQPVSSATVSVSFDGPTNGSTNGVTDANGLVTLVSSKKKNPAGEWCFDVTNITHATLSYDSGANVTNRSCESGDVNNANDENRIVAREFSLGQNFPNPFNPITEIKFNLPRASSVSLKVYNVRGRVVSELASGSMAAGPHSVRWDAREFPSGIYFYRLVTPENTDTRKMIMLK